MATSKSVFTYIFKLSAFAAICIALGIVALILAFAPATNPNFLHSVLFRGSTVSDRKELSTFARTLMGQNTPSAAILDALNTPPSDEEFKKLGLEVPEKFKFSTTDKVELEGWFFAGSGADTVLVCYNGFGKRLPLTAGYVKMLRAAGPSVFLFDYRGLNNSAVKASPQTACIDGQAAYDFLIKEKKISPEHLILLGRDIGSYVCLKIAASNKCKALILENPWTTVKDYVDKVPGALAMRLVPQQLYTDGGLNNLELVGKEHAPILVASSEPEMTGAGKFYKSISAPKVYMHIEEFMPSMLCPDLAEGGAKYTRYVKKLTTGEPLVAEQAGKVDWKKDYAAALAESKQSNKPLLVEFGAPWCHYCRKMDELTYVDPDVATKLNKDYVAVRLDMESKESQALQTEHPFNGIPMVFVMDSNGKLLKQLPGFMGPDRFLKRLAQSK